MCSGTQVGGSGDDDDNDNVGDEGETKPKPAPAGSEEGAGGGGVGGGSETITIRVKDQNGEETMFKIKKSTRMMKVFATYAARKGVEATALRFMIDGDVRFFLLCQSLTIIICYSTRYTSSFIYVLFLHSP